MGAGRFFQKTSAPVSLMTTDLSNEPNFGRIHLAGQFKQLLLIFPALKYVKSSILYSRGVCRPRLAVEVVAWEWWQGWRTWGNSSREHIPRLSRLSATDPSSSKGDITRTGTFLLLRITVIDSTESPPFEKLIPLWNWFFDALIPCEGIEDSEFSLSYVVFVWGKDTPIDQHISNTQTICQLSAGDEKPIRALKINILWDMVDSIPHLFPTNFQGFSPHNPSKNTGSRLKRNNSFHIVARKIAALLQKILF